MTALQPVIQSRILALREQRVMLDADLAQLYGVETRVLVQAVKRNLARFPEDFMFQLSAQEFANLRSQTVISSAASSTGHGGRRSAPYAFTEQGVAMLSTVLGSPRAIAVNIEIARTGRHACGPGQAAGRTRRQDRGAGHEPRHLQPQHARSAEAGVRCAARTHDATQSAKRPIGFVTPQDKGKRTEGAKRKT
jgi:hypothetical protein